MQWRARAQPLPGRVEEGLSGWLFHAAERKVGRRQDAASFEDLMTRGPHLKTCVSEVGSTADLLRGEEVRSLGKGKA